MNTDQLIVHESATNSDEGMRGVYRLMEKGIALGPPWIREHPQTERTLFLVLEFEFAEEFEKSWCILKSEHEEGQLKQVQVCNGAIVTEAHKADITPALKKDKPALKKAEIPKPEKREIPKAEKESQHQWKEALKLKGYIMKVTSSAIELDEQINVSAEWKWAKNEKNQGELKTKLVAVKCRYSSFHRQFMTEDPTTLKKRFGADHIRT